MEITFSKRNTLFSLAALLVILGLVVILLKRYGPSITRAIGVDSGRGAALAGAKAFYGVDYRDGADQWAARLCALSSQPACEYYQKTVAPFLWPAFSASQTVVTAEAADPVFVTEELAATRGDAPMQVWRVAVSLSAPWPQGDGETAFPAHVLVVQEADGWKFERFLLADEVAAHTGGEK